MGVQLGNQEFEGNINGDSTMASASLPVKAGFWSKVKSFLFQDIVVELTPAQQRFEDNMNEFLHQEVDFGKVHDFLFQEISFGKKN